MNELRQFLNSNYSWVAQRAQDALQIKAAAESKQITVEQAAELLNNLIDTDALDKEATDFTIRTKLVNAINNLISALSNITSLPGF